VELGVVVAADDVNGVSLGEKSGERVKNPAVSQSLLSAPILERKGALQQARRSDVQGSVRLAGSHVDAFCAEVPPTAKLDRPPAASRPRASSWRVAMSFIQRHRQARRA
jgi:hypothetical protein